MRKIRILILCSLIFILQVHAADVIFGRRVYAEQGRSYQQIWTLDLRTRKITQLTNSERRHGQPSCSPDENRIWFFSVVVVSLNKRELWWFDPHARTEKLAVKLNVRPVTLIGGAAKEVFFTALDGDKPGLYRWDGRLTKMTAIAETLGAAALSPDGRTLVVQTGKAAPLTMMDATGRAGRKIEGCAEAVWSGDGRKIACTAGARVRVMDAATGVEVANADFRLRSTPPYVQDFSSDGKRLLVGTVGANHTTTSPQLDYWTVELATGKWDLVGPGQGAVFAATGVILATPRDLAKVGKGHDWVSQLLMVDPGTHAQTPVAAGTASNVEPKRCGQTAR